MMLLTEARVTLRLYNADVKWRVAVIWLLYNGTGLLCGSVIMVRC